MTEEKDILTAKEAAELLRFNPFVLKQKAGRGEIPGRRVGRKWLFSRRQLIAWIEEG